MQISLQINTADKIYLYDLGYTSMKNSADKQQICLWRASATKHHCVCSQAVRPLRGCHCILQLQPGITDAYNST